MVRLRRRVAPGIYIDIAFMLCSSPFYVGAATFARLSGRSALRQFFGLFFFHPLLSLLFSFLVGLFQFMYFQFLHCLPARSRQLAPELVLVFFLEIERAS